MRRRCRYKETCRRHPLLDECDGCLEDAIREERRLLKPIRDAADYIIDTTSLSPSQLRGRIVTIFEGETTSCSSAASPWLPQWSAAGRGSGL